MEVASGVNTESLIPYHQVIGALGDGHVAVWADPSLGGVFTSAIGGLHGVINSPAVLGSADANAQQIHFQFGFGFALLGSARSIAATHLVPAIVV